MKNKKHIELYHHGVKGMHWGQHIFGKEAKNTANSLSDVGKNFGSVGQALDKAKAPQQSRYPMHTLTKHEMKHISDDDLRRLTNRLQTEQTYSNLTAKPSKDEKAIKRYYKIQSGLTAAAAVVSIGGVLYNIYNAAKDDDK